MFKIYFINHGYSLDEEFDSIVLAILEGRRRGFEFSVLNEYGELMGSCTGVSLTWRQHNP